MTSTESTHVWQPASDGPAVRGTVILLPGRGEHGGVYERFGKRLSHDAYTVHALDISADTDLSTLSHRIDRIAAQASGPVVLAGSDTGALQALALVSADAVRVDGLLLVGLPDTEAGAESGTGTGLGADTADPEEAGWDHELAARTSCPTHQARLTADAEFARGSLSDPVPPHLAAVLQGTGVEGVDTPTLLLHGGADTVAPVDHARGVAARLPRGELAVTTDGTTC
ncbi:alpha/beta hydrolase [Catenulispora yoronensis]